MDETPERAEFKEHLWEHRPLTVREDGWDGLPNLFRWLFRRSSRDMCWSYTGEPVTLAPGESHVFLFPAPIIVDEDEP